MSHAVEKRLFGFWKTFWIALAIVVVILLLVGAVNFASNSGSGSVAARETADYKVLNVGPKNEEEVKIPILHYVMFEFEKGNIIIRRPDGEFFIQTPERRYYQYNKKTGKYDTEVPNFGFNVSRVYLRSTEGVVRVERSFVSGELIKPAAPTPPAPTSPTVTPPTVAPTPPAVAPLPPARRPRTPTSGVSV